MTDKQIDRNIMDSRSCNKCTHWKVCILKKIVVRWESLKGYDLLRFFMKEFLGINDKNLANYCKEYDKGGLVPL